ncbi:MAG: NapC/NirT family cytochrome c, partial [Candidatus Eiseniibacteriota bacterium]
LNDPRHRFAAIVFTVGTIAFLGMSGFGSFKAYEYTESDQFCGTMCHQVMHPEYTAYRESPHARVGCVNCHIGPGAEWFVRSKLSGAYQVYATLADVYPRPIPTPIENLRPARETCEQCHWPKYFASDSYVVHDYYGPEDDNPHWRLHLLMKIGGAGDWPHDPHGIHAHIAWTTEYVATDERRNEIPWVRTTDLEGNVKVFRSTEADFDDEALAEAEARGAVRRMDCIDCHNRPTHHYDPPARLVNQAIAAGQISTRLPSVKSAVVDAMEESYDSSEAAHTGVPAAVRAYYADHHPELADSLAAEIDQAAGHAWRLYSTNIFPEMNVSWKSFPNHIGHLTTPGCFRCHDGLHETEDGEVITRDCNNCHVILSQAFDDGTGFVALGGEQYRHPEDIDGAWQEMNCSECHGP